MSNFRVFVTIDVEDSKGKAAIKDVKSKLDKIPGKKKIHFESNAQGLMGNLRDLTVVLGGVMRGYQMVKRAAEEVIKAQEKQIENEAKVRQGIKATGGAAGFQADQLIKLAAAWQQQYLIADEVLLDAQAKLLSFTNVTGERFTRTLMSAANVAIVMNDDINTMTQTVVQLGKALNDPLTGLTLLNRSGITFSEQQKEQIKVLVKSNKLLEAQGIILDELDNQYGGQAEALAALESGPMKAYRLALGDMQERMGAVAQSILYDLVMNLKPLIEGIDETKIKIGLLIGIAGALIITSNKLIKTLTTLGVVFKMSTGWIGATVTILGTLITGLILFTKTQRQANTERREAVRTLIDQNEHLIKQAKRYRDLREQEVLTGAEEDELKSIREELISQHPELVRGTEDYERALNGLKLELESLNEEQLMLSLFEERKELKDFQKDIGDAEKDFEKYFKGMNYHFVIDPITEAGKITKDTYQEIFDIAGLTKDKIEGIVITPDLFNPEKISEAMEVLRLKIFKTGMDLTDIQRGIVGATKEEITGLEKRKKLYLEAWNIFKDIKESRDGIEGTEQRIDEIRRSQILNRGLLNEKEKEGLSAGDLIAYYEKYKFQDLQYFEWKKQQLTDSVNAQEISDAEKEQLLDDHLAKLQQSRDAFFNKEDKEAMSPKDLAKYYNEMKFLDKGYFAWKKEQIKKEVEDMDIFADKKRNITNKLLDDLLDDYLGFYDIVIDKAKEASELSIIKPKFDYSDMKVPDIEFPDVMGLEKAKTDAEKTQSAMELFSNAVIGAMGNVTSLSKISEISFGNIAAAIDQMLADILKSLLARALIFALFSMIPGVGANMGKFTDFLFGVEGKEHGTDEITEKDITRVPGADLGNEDGIIAIQKKEAVVNKEGTQHEFNKAMINLMNKGIDISNLIPQFETGTVMPSPDIHIKTGQSINDKNIIKALKSIVSEIRLLDEHFVEKEDREIREIKESKELEHEIEYIDKDKATEKLTELGNMLGDIITAGTEATPQSTEKALDVILNIKKEFADPEPAGKPVSGKTDISEFEKVLKESIDRKPGELQPIKEKPSRDETDISEFRKVLKESIDRRTEFEQVIKEEPVHDKSDMSDFNKALTEFMNQGVDMAELIAQIGQDRVVVVPEVNIQPGQDFNDKNIVEALVKVIDKVKILNENLVEKDMSPTIINKNNIDFKKLVREIEKMKNRMVKAGYDVDSRL